MNDNSEMLSPYRVLDLTDDRGHFAGHVLAQFGADVVAVEPEGGHRSRRLGSFSGVPSGNSFMHQAYNRGKRSVVVTGRDELETLAAGADVLIECGAMNVDLPALRAANPALITASISPFGADGPKAGWAGSDLVNAAASGTLSMSGDPDRPPVRSSQPLTWHFAAMEALTGIMVALTERTRSGLGQHIDIAAQEAYIVTSQMQMMSGLVDKAVAGRVAGGLKLGPVILQIVHPALDGHVTCAFLFGPVFGPYTVRLFSWMHEEGFCGREWLEIDWEGFGLALSSDPEALRLLDEGTRILSRFTATKTKAELLSRALSHDLLFAPCNTAAELLEMDQLRERSYWEDVDGISYPGPIARLSKTPLLALGAAPELGGHTAQILAEDGRPSVGGESGDGDAPALDGLKVLDFTWAIAGPGTTRILADHGAEVIRVESIHKPDALRGQGPYLDEDGDPEGSLAWHHINAGKSGVTIKLTDPASREVVLDLVRWADVVIESFSAGTMERWDLSYDDLCEVNPAVIMVSSCLLGQSGPMSGYAGFGTMGSAVAGFFPIVGWPDRAPVGPWGAYSDYPAPRLTASVILAAVEARRRTGEGQYIDFSQMEAAMQLLAPIFVEQSATGYVAGRHGNKDPNMAPHGVFPTCVEDDWIAVVCETDEQWRSLAEQIGSDLGDLGLAERIERSDELEAMVATWSASRAGSAMEQSLQAAGVPAHRVLTAHNLFEDPQVVHRNHFMRASHPNGETWVEAMPFHLSRTPASVKWAGPTFGQHLWDVLTETLGYDEDKAAALIATGAFE